MTIDPVSVKMLQDDAGYTSHLAGPPQLIEVKKGDTPVVSRDLATLWRARGACDLVQADEAVEADAKAVVKEQAAHDAKVQKVKKTAAARSAATKKRRAAA